MKAEAVPDDDPQAERRQVPSLLTEEGSEDRQASQSWNLPFARGGGEARARGAVLQARALSLGDHGRQANTLLEPAGPPLL